MGMPCLNGSVSSMTRVISAVMWARPVTMGVTFLESGRD